MREGGDNQAAGGAAQTWLGRWLWLLLGVVLAGSTLAADEAPEEAAVPINLCPAVVIAEPIKVRLQEMRDKYNDNCLECAGKSCRFVSGLTQTETRICQTLFCQPVRISKQGFLDWPGSVNGPFSYRYSLSLRGRPTNVEVVGDLDSTAREAALRVIRTGLNGRKFRPIELDGKRFALEGLEGEVKIRTDR